MKLSETRLSKYLHISKYSFSCEFKHANTNATCLFSFKHMNMHIWPVEKRFWCWVIHTASCIPDYSASVLIKERTLFRVFLFKCLSELYCCLWDVLKQRSNLKTAKFVRTYYFCSARVKSSSKMKNYFPSCLALIVTSSLRIYAFVVPSKSSSPPSLFKSTNTCDYEWCHQKAQLTYLLFRESRGRIFLRFGKCFPCVVVRPMFERRFCSGGLCFLTSASGIFRCWLWIISCNDGSPWHVCLDSMPSSWKADQTELSYRLQI